MGRVGESAKNPHGVAGIEFAPWGKWLQAQLNHEHQELSDNWKMCALGERIRIEGNDLQNIDELTPEARLLGHDFSVAIQNSDDDTALEIIEKIEKLPTIWRD